MKKNRQKKTIVLWGLFKLNNRKLRCAKNHQGANTITRLIIRDHQIFHCWHLMKGATLKQIRSNWQTLNHRGQQAIILFLGRKVCTSVPQVLLIQLWNSWFIWFLFLCHCPQFWWFIRKASFASLLLNLLGTILQRPTVDWHPWPNFCTFFYCIAFKEGKWYSSFYNSSTPPAPINLMHQFCK